MRLHLKKLNGPECSTEVSPNINVLELKEKASRLLGIPQECTKLVFKGKTLADDKAISYYNIGSEAKVFVVQKRAAEASSVNGSLTKGPDFWEELEKLLLKHFTTTDAKLVLDEFRKNFQKDMDSLSLDDIERLAKANLEALKSSSGS